MPPPMPQHDLCTWLALTTKRTDQPIDQPGHAGSARPELLTLLPFAFPESPLGHRHSGVVTSAQGSCEF